MRPLDSGAPEARSGVGAERIIRVSVKTIESIAQQMESVTLLRARDERRLREMSARTAVLSETRALCQQALDSLRQANRDEAMQRLGDALARLRTLERALAHASQRQMRETEQVHLISTMVREDLRDLRMVPASTALEPLRRTAREIAGRLGKQIDLSSSAARCAWTAASSTSSRSPCSTWCATRSITASRRRPRAAPLGSLPRGLWRSGSTGMEIGWR